MWPELETLELANREVVEQPEIGHFGVGALERATTADSLQHFGMGSAELNDSTLLRHLRPPTTFKAAAILLSSVVVLVSSLTPHHTSNRHSLAFGFLSHLV